MPYLGLLKLLLSLVDQLFTYVNNNKLMKAGEAQTLQKQMEILNEKISKATEARQRITDIADSDELFQDDGYRRD